VNNWFRYPRWANRQLALSAALFLAFGGSVLFSVAATRQADGISTVWLANGFLAAGWLLLDRRMALALAGACLLVNIACNQLMSDPPAVSILFSLINQAEAFTAAWLARRACGQMLRLTSLTRVMRLLVFAIAPATAGAALLAANISTLFGRSFNGVLGDWFYADALGMMIVLPPVLLIARPVAAHDFRRSRWEAAAIYGLIAAVSGGRALPFDVPLILLLFPAFALAAFRLGPRGAAIGALIMAVASTCVTASGYGVPAYMQWDLARRIHVLQFLIATAFTTGLCMAMAVAHHDRLKRLWASRHRAVRKAQARAVASGRAKAEFLATMSHEIRTPMSSIVGFTEVLLQRDDLTNAARRQLGLIERAAASLLTVVDDVLDVSTMDAGQVQLVPRPRAPRAVAQDALAIVAETARRKGLSIEMTAVGPAHRLVMFDDLRVRQVLLNLLNNAVKFTDQGRIRLDVEVRDGPDEALLRFSVKDTGIGVPSDKIDRLFKRFSQVDGSASRAFAGAGLGLSICKGLVELMGGRIGVDSAPGVGSVFWFEIPAPHAEPAVEPAAEPAETGPAARVLLVDDHPVNRELGLAMLALLGCQVDLAQGGEEAIQAARTTAYDVILMDIHMPGMDGVEAASAIRALGGEAARTPILALSADVMPEVIARCRRVGMVDALAKPIQLQALQSAVARWAGRTPEDQARAA